LALLGGGLMALTYLTKASVLPALVLFLLCVLLQVFLYLQGQQAEKAKKQLLSGVLLLATFLLVISPYITNSKLVFGQYFYNVNTTFYIWYDSWAEIETGTKAYGDRLQWPDMPPEDLPTAANYLRSHTTADILTRFGFGSLGVLGNMLYSYGYFKYWLGLAVFLFVVMIVDRQRTSLLMRTQPVVIFFLAAYFCGYLLLYFWFGPIMAGNRLILAQFLPFMFAALYGLQRYYSALVRVPKWIRAAQIVDISPFLLSVTAVVFLIDLYFIFAFRIGTLLGGS
jgi:hypothetical protein